MISTVGEGLLYSECLIDRGCLADVIQLKYKVY